MTLNQETLLKSLSEQIAVYNKLIKTLPAHNVKYKRKILIQFLSNSGQRNRKHWKIFDESLLENRLLLYYKEWKIRYKELQNWRPAERDDKFRLDVFKSDELVKHITTVDFPPTPDHFLTIQSFIELS